MSRTPILAGLALSIAFAAAAQQPPSAPEAQYKAEAKAASDRYESDLKLCADEQQSNARLQCRRDAKGEYDKAAAAAKSRRDAALAQAAPALKAKPAASAVPPACADCGKVIEVAVGHKAGDSSAVGVLAGGAAGALLGRQVGSGSGRDLATIAGAVGGAYAGKKIEEKVKTRKIWTVGVQYPDKTTARYEFDADPGYKVGDSVRRKDATIARP